MPLLLFVLPSEGWMVVLVLVVVLLVVVVVVLVVVVFPVVPGLVLRLRLSASAGLVDEISLFFQDPSSRVCQVSPFFLYTVPCLSVYTLFLRSTVPGLL